MSAKINSECINCVIREWEILLAKYFSAERNSSQHSIKMNFYLSYPEFKNYSETYKKTQENLDSIYSTASDALTQFELTHKIVLDKYKSLISVSKFKIKYDEKCSGCISHKAVFHPS
jgi:hypothetical protein